MKRPGAFLSVFVVAGFLGIICSGCSSDSTTSISTNRIYLMNATKGTLTPAFQSTGESTSSAAVQSWEYTLTLENVSEEMLWYTNRPDRQSGTVRVEYFVQTIWPAVFVSIAPNALLDGWIPPNILNDGLFLILRDPRYDSTSKKLTFNVTLENSTMDNKRPELTVDFEDIKMTILNNNEDGMTDTYSFAQVAPSAYFEETGAGGVYTLHLNDVYAESYYLADAPDRFSFVYPVELFEMAWPNVFGNVPPNASMTSYTASGKLMTHIMTLDHPVYDPVARLLTYTATLLHGTIKNNQTLTSPTLFIDAADSSSCDTQMGTTGFTKRVTVINNCGENTWLYMKVPSTASAQWDFWKTASGGQEVWTGGTTGAGTAYVKSELKIGIPYHFCVPDKGAASGNFQIFMEPCKQTGDDCMIGTLVGNDRNGVNTLFELTFGCMPGTANCSKNPSDPTKDITPVDWFDISAVSGYTVPMYLQIVNAHKLTCTASSTDASMLDMASCPSENKPWPDGYGTTMVAVNPAPASTCQKAAGAATGQCTGNGYAPCHNDTDCTDGNTQMRTILNAGFSLLTQGVGGRNGYQGCASPCDYLSGHQLGNPAKTWNNSSGDVMGAMASSGYLPNTLPLNTACWYCCVNTVNASAPGQGGVQCDKGPKSDGTTPIGLAGYVRRIKEMGMNGYAWQYDDYSANHNCNQTSSATSARFLLTLCPGSATGASYPWPAGSKPYLTTQGWNWSSGKCTASNSGGTYTSLYACQVANLKYECKAVLSGNGDVSHNFCLPVQTGGQAYDTCKTSCY